MKLNTSNLVSPCLDCPDREIGCHSTCERYQSFRKALDKELLVERSKKKKETDIKGIEANRAERIQKYMKKRGAK